MSTAAKVISDAVNLLATARAKQYIAEFATMGQDPKRVDEFRKNADMAQLLLKKALTTVTGERE